MGMYFLKDMWCRNNVLYNVFLSLFVLSDIWMEEVCSYIFGEEGAKGYNPCEGFVWNSKSIIIGKKKKILKEMIFSYLILW